MEIKDLDKITVEDIFETAEKVLLNYSIQVIC